MQRVSTVEYYASKTTLVLLLRIVIFLNELLCSVMGSFMLLLECLIFIEGNINKYHTNLFSESEYS